MLARLHSVLMTQVISCFYFVVIESVLLVGKGLRWQGGLVVCDVKVARDKPSADQRDQRENHWDMHAKKDKE